MSWTFVGGAALGSLKESGFNNDVNLINSSSAEAVINQVLFSFCWRVCWAPARRLVLLRHWSTTALTPKVQNIFSFTYLQLPSPSSLPSADSLISHLIAKRTEIQYYQMPTPSLSTPHSASSLPHYHPSPWKPFGWVSNHNNLHLRSLTTCSP